MAQIIPFGESARRGPCRQNANAILRRRKSFAFKLRHFAIQRRKHTYFG